VAATHIISIIGRKNAGKTTLTVALAAELGRRGLRVMTLKHGHHPATADREGTDSWRHFEEARAERTLFVGPETNILYTRAADRYEPLPLIRQHLHGADVVLVEGYKRSALPKIEVHREKSGPAIYDPVSPEATQWIALVTDTAHPNATCRVLRFTDTMWLQLLASIAMERALVIDT
jgi:molybdopterin-guanine dinucleotide biosynthesis protein B